ncbi:interferon-induced very large GTPase 1-like [Mytilus edulis]|uniref:interferon-induced very large GTPase 1-like n=1 Tax=Mytilus edulis TaxID=6550 RepID=UPI0039EF9C22
MDMAVAVDPNVSDQDVFLDALDPDEMQDLWKLSEKEILEIAGEIGGEWKSLGIHLGYTSAKLNHLEDVYPRDPQWRNVMMIGEWCSVITSLHLNVKQYLAKFLSEAGQANIADSLSTDYNIVVPSSVAEIKKHVKHISFDRPIPKVMGLFDMTEIVKRLGRPNQIRFEMHFYGCQQEAIQTKVTEWRQNSDNSVEVPDDEDVWSFDDMQLALHETKMGNKTAALSKLLRDLSLESYYPDKIMISDIQEIKSMNQELDENNLPWFLLNKIMMLNYNAREEDLNMLFEKSRNEDEDFEPDSDDGLFDDTTINSINPSDLFYVTFLCCHPFLKQDIISKLFACKLAIPFIYHDFDKLVLSQWVLRKVLIDKRTDDKITQLDALHHEVKIVSFLRFGPLSISKSKIINEILHDQCHPTFFNRDCHFGTTSGLAADGIVEASWYVPSGRKNDIFDDVVMVLNLRGDSSFYRKETEIIRNLSHVIVVHSDIEQLTSEQVKKSLLALHCNNLPVIYALEASSDIGKSPAEIWRSYKSSMNMFKTQIKVFNLKTSKQTKSSSDITKEMRKLLVDSLSDRKATKLINKTRKLQFIDENQMTECTESKRIALTLMHEISGLEPTMKETILPLQGQLWASWCSDLKKRHKSKSDVEKEQLESRMDLLRAEQISKLEQHHNKFMALFIRCLGLESIQNVDQTIFFLNWIKIYLDDKCRLNVPQLVLKYQQGCVALRNAVEKNNYKLFENLRLALDNAEHDLVEASFGLEHLVRELGQIYEAVMSRSAYVSSSVQKFPELVSKLIQHGYPLEIMNGDTATVPLVWIEAVLDRLQKDLGDKKLLTISVLGIQSSGKSTLLNAMFGLQFAVSAGRCTKGVFAQLVKVQEGILPYDYVLVIDTEGLRAPELGDTKHSHDNELATFVLGLGNITVINIKGENTQEIEDVLQIAVHAFLRLKMANDNLKMQQTCIFVHQNVSAVDASAKMIHARQKMMEKLDKLTREAAKHEGIADVNSFNQVIEVNPETHMWYFSDLWKGDPPMAPINVGYSRNVQEVKHQILFDFPLKRKTFLTISQMTTQMRDLWYGILSDNFVFSFRNSLEVKAYHTMEETFNKLNWSIERKVRGFVQKTVNVQIIRCIDDKMLEEKTIELLKTLNTFLQTQLEEKTNQWNSFIDNCPLRDIMEQWRQNRILYLTENVIDLKRNGEKNIRKMKTQQATNLVRINKRTKHELELRDKAEALANQFQGKSLPEAELEKKFNSTWAKWVSGIEHDNISEKQSVKDEVEKILFDLFEADGQLIYNELKRLPKIVQSEKRNPEYSISFTDLEDSHISVSKVWYEKIVVSAKPKKLQCKQHALNIINMILGNIHNFLISVLSQDSPFEKTHAKEVFMIIRESLHKHNSLIDDHHSFTFTAALRVKLAVHVARSITDVFNYIDKRYEENHNVMAQIENYKTSTWLYFKDVYDKKNIEVKTANMLARSVEDIVKREIQEELPLKIVKTIVNEHFSSKHSLMLEVMKDLALKDDFDSFYRYIQDAENFVLKWITSFTNDRLFKPVRKSGNKYIVIVQDLIEKHFIRINNCAELATKNMKSPSSNISRWINLFENSLARNLPIPVRTFHQFVPKNQKGASFQNLHKCFVGLLDGMKSNLLIEFQNESRHFILWKEQHPCKTIFDKLWGCNERCPFCNEVCEKTTKNHLNVDENHTCIQHRPLGIRGAKTLSFKIISWESCNYQVNSDSRFLCSLVKGKCKIYGKCDGLGTTEVSHYFKDYKYLFPEWKIKHSAFMDSSSYWMWFVYTYRNELSLTYNYSIPVNVLKWGYITKEDAIRSLRQD